MSQAVPACDYLATTAKSANPSHRQLDATPVERMSMNQSKKSHSDNYVKGKRVLVRVDFNVPQVKKTGEITNNNHNREKRKTLATSVSPSVRLHAWNRQVHARWQIA
jgi:hypothetical protein